MLSASCGKGRKGCGGVDSRCRSSVMATGDMLYSLLGVVCAQLLGIALGIVLVLRFGLALAGYDLLELILEWGMLK